MTTYCFFPLLVASSLCGFFAQGQSLFLDFDTADQYTVNFNAWNDNGSGSDGGNYSFAEGTATGVASSGGVSVFQSNDTTATYKNGSWNFSTNGAALTLSVMLQADGQSSGNKVQLGILNTKSNGFNSNPNIAFESFRFIPSSATVWSLREQYRTGNANTETTLGNVSVISGQWYKFAISVTNTSGLTGNYNAGCTLLDCGSDGLSPGTNVINFSTTEIHGTGQDIAKLSAVWPGLRAYQNAGVNAWDNFLVYTPASSPVITLALANTNVMPGKPTTFQTLAEGPGLVSYAWFTNGTQVAGATSSTYTTPPFDTNLTNLTVVARNGNGSVTNSATLAPAILATVTNVAATDVQTASAMLNGQVLSTGGDSPNVTLYYGTTDGGTNDVAWANSLPLGCRDGSFSSQIMGLSAGVTYFFSAKAVNSVGASWASPSKSFATLLVAPSLTSYVNPFIGTSPSPLSSYGFSFDTGDVFPGAAFPLGMFQFSPDTPINLPGGYNYPDTSIKGFSVRHFSGRGITCYQDFSFKPFLGQVTVSPATNSAYSVAFTHANESASPGYYSVLLNNGVRVQLTSTMRTGMGKFTFPKTNAATLLIDAGASISGTTANTSITILGTNQIQGYATTHIGGGSQNYTIYFVAQFDRGFNSSGTWNGGTVNPGTLSSTGSQVGAFVTFDSTINPTVSAKIGISFVSIANALANLNAENSNWDFAAVQGAADQAWNNVLNKIVVSGGTTAQLQTFYTALYHCFFHPNVFNDVNGQYRGMDGQIHTVAVGHSQYENLPCWDMYRSAFPLRAFLSPGVASDIAQSLVNYAQQGGGGLPRWEQVNRNSGGMIGDGPVIVLATAYALGATNFDTTAALAAMKKNAGTIGTTSDGNTVRSGLSDYLNLGYVANNVSATLEYCAADFALCQFAQALGDSDPTDVAYLNRSGNWLNLFNTTNNLIQCRDTNGAWAANVTPTSTSGYTEGSAMQYTRMVPFNVKGLINALGGNSNAISILDNYFQQLNAGPNSSYEWAGNEPTECDAWEYDFAGAPWKTQNTVRRIQMQCFTNTVSGFPGNDDAGAISSWYVFSALGFYPEIPSAGGFVIGSPLFPSATINLENGHQINIQGNNASVQNPYVQSLAVNGASITSLWLPFSTLSDGANLVFNLTNAPSTWGCSAADAPPSFVNKPSAPPVPAGLAASVDGTQVTLSWFESVGATSYNIKYAITNGGPYVTIANVAGTSCLQTGFTNGGTYYYVVSAVSASGQSGNSSQASVTVPAMISIGAQAASGKFSVQVQGVNGQKYIIVSSTNLMDWTPVFTNVPKDGLFIFTDTNSIDATRFYRVKQEGQ